jgi:hypothetical protein
VRAGKIQAEKEAVHRIARIESTQADAGMRNGLPWNLIFDSQGFFQIESTVSKRIGKATHSFPVASSESLTVNPLGQLVGDAHVGLTRAVMIPRYGSPILCSAWDYSNGVASFTCDDTALKDNQLPYRIDPQTWVTLTDSGQYNIDGWCDNDGNCGSDSAHVNVDTSAVVPGNATVSSYWCDYNVIEIDSGGDQPNCSFIQPYTAGGTAQISVGISSDQQVFSDSAVVNEVGITVIYTPPPAAATPTLSLVAGTYPQGTTVSLSTGTSGASIHYTTDGSTPSSTVGTLYTSPITLTTPAQINAVAYGNLWATNSVASAIYNLYVDTPVLSPGAGTYNTAQNITLSLPNYSGLRAIAYTTDGSTPNVNSPTYTSGLPITLPLNSTTTINSISFPAGSSGFGAAGWIASPMASAAYTITGTVAQPTFSVAAGTYTSAQSVTLSSSPSGASFIYTTDGSTPTESHGTAYAGAISIASSTTLKAIAYKANWTDSPVSSATYTITGTVATPSISPAAGTYTSGQSITLSTTTSGRRSATPPDGSTPSETAGTVYGGAFTVNASATVKAIAFESAWLDSAIASAAYTITGTVATPAFSPASGTYTSAQSVSISTTTSGATIRYTTDGSTPSETAGTVYSGAISVSATETPKAIAYESGWIDSAIGSATYTITGTVVTPTFSLAAGTYTSAQTVSLSTTTSGATIRYTTDGSTPSETAGTVYGGAITISASETVKAIAYESAWLDSAVASAAYTITGTVATPVFSVAAGTYTTTQSVTLSTTTSGATIRYTTDGSTPSEAAGTVYSSAISVSATETIKAIAYESAWLDSAVASAAYTISPVLTSVAVNPSPLTSTNSATVTVTLSAPAPSSGAVVTLGSTNTPAFNPPANITVPAGQASGTASVTAGTVGSSTSVTVTGNYGGAQTGSVTVLPLPSVSGVSISPSAVSGGGSATVTVTLSAPAPSSGAVVTLGSTNTAAFNPPASITVAGGQTSNSVSVTSATVSTTTNVTVTGTYGGTSQSGSITVNAPPQLTPGTTPSAPLAPSGQQAISANQAVTWTVSPSAAGSFSPGSTTANKSTTFTVASSIPNSALSATITASDSTNLSNSVVVNLLPPVTITPSSAGSMPAGATQPFSANIPVTWSVSPTNGGTFSLTSTNAGQQTTFTMGSLGVANVTVTATDQRYSTNSSWVAIGDPPIITPGSTPAAPLTPGGALTISANQAVTWSVVPASAGTFGAASSGANVNDTFTAANPIPNSALSATITATGSGGATAQLVVNLAPGIVISPASPSGLASGATAQFSANIPVSWTVPTTNGGSVSPTSTSAGQATTFTAGTAGTHVTLTATDQRFSSNAASVTIPPGTVATPVAVSPIGQQGSEQTFIFRFSDTGGGSTLTSVSAWIAPNTNSTANSCLVIYNPAQNSLALLTDGGGQPASTITPGGSGVAQNSQCTLTGSGSSVSLLGPRLYMTLMLGFTEAYIGGKNLYGSAQDSTGSNSGWVNLGTYNVIGVPTVLPMNPYNGQSITPTVNPQSPLSMNFEIQDGLDLPNIGLVEISFGAPPTGGNGPVNGCEVLYNNASGTFYLANNSGNWSATLSNSQCYLSGSPSAGNGSTGFPTPLSITLSMGFYSSYIGFYPIYVQAQDQAGFSSGWVQVGTVTVESPGSLTIDTVTLNNQGSEITLTAGQTAQVEVQLNGTAPSGGTAVSLAANNPNVLSVPATLTVPAGQTTGSATVTAVQPASGPVGVYVLASYGAVQQAPSPLILVTGVSYPITTLTTSPPGLAVTVDGVSQTTPYNVVWSGTGHTITASSQNGAAGTQYVFGNWSGPGTCSTPSTQPSGSLTCTAVFQTWYTLTPAVSPAGSGSISANGTTITQPTSYNSAAPVAIAPTANSAYGVDRCASLPRRPWRGSKFRG